MYWRDARGQERDKATEAVVEVRKRLQDQQTLCDRTQGIAEQYQKKIRITQSSVTHFGDIQLYQASLKQMQQAVAFIRTQIAALELELKRKQQMLTQTEMERQKYQKLIEREKEQVAKLLAHQEARELDDIGGQMRYRGDQNWPEHCCGYLRLFSKVESAMSSTSSITISLQTSTPTKGVNSDKVNKNNGSDQDTYETGFDAALTRRAI